MPTVHQSNTAKGLVNPPYPARAGEVVAIRETFEVTTAIGGAAGDIIEMLPIPPGCVPVDAVVHFADLDDATAMIVDIGVMSGAWGDADDTRTCGDELFDGIDTPQAGGVARPTLAKAFTIARSNTHRSIGIKVATAAGTPAAGTVGLTVWFAAG
jgi:hypothetical protein